MSGPGPSSGGAPGGTRGPAAPEGAILIDKPSGPTSHDVVDAVRRAIGMRRVGHTGTLDPLATGLLVLLTGQATRLASLLSGQGKAYEGEALLGCATDTYDAAGRPLGEPSPAGHLTQADLERAAARLTGPQLQAPPPYSARHAQGTRLYRLARRGQPIELPPVPIEVFAFAVRLAAGGRFTFDLTVSSGTYVRSLIHDMGRALGCGAHVTRLRRTASEPFALDSAVPLAAFVADPGRHLEGGSFFPLDAIPLPVPRVEVDAEAARDLAHGRPVHPTAPLPDGPILQLRDLGGRLLALGEPDGAGWIRPRAVLGRGLEREPAPLHPPSQVVGYPVESEEETKT